MNASIVDLRYRMKDVLRAIERGETVTVLYRGKAKASLTPLAISSHTFDNTTPKTADQPFFGIWNDRDDLTDPAAYVRKLREPRVFADEASLKRQQTARKRK